MSNRRRRRNRPQSQAQVQVQAHSTVAMSGDTPGDTPGDTMSLLIDETLTDAPGDDVGTNNAGGAWSAPPGSGQVPFSVPAPFSVVPEPAAVPLLDRAGLIRLYGDVRCAVSAQLGLSSELVKGLDATLLELHEIEGERGPTVTRLLRARRAIAAAYQEFGGIMHELAPS